MISDNLSNYSIGEISKMLGIKEHTVRFWEKEFPIIKPARKSNGRRQYSEQDLAILQEIKRLLYEEGFTTKGALKEILDHQKFGNLVLHQDEDLFTLDVKPITPENINKKETPKSNLYHVAKRVEESNKTSQRPISQDTGSTLLQNKLDQAVYTKIYKKVDALIKYLEKN